MAHEVIATQVLVHKDLKITIKTAKGGKSRKLGTLLISRKSLEWKPRKHSVNRHQIGWEDFADFMEIEGKPIQVKSGAK